MKKRVLRRGIVGLVLAGITIGAIALLQTGHYDVLQPQGIIAEKQYRLLLFTLLLSAVVVVPVFFMLGLFAWKYRASRPTAKKKNYRPEWASNTALESIWWGIPIAIIAVLAVVAWQTSHDLDPYKPIVSSREPLEVQVVALEWKWLFLYPELGIATVNHLPIEVDQPVHFTLTADAPMSAFWIPTLGSQIYTMSGMSSQLNLMATNQGEYMGYTTNINGRGYADMKFTTRALSSDDFADWLKKAKQTTKVMNENAYRELAKPSEKNDEAVYVLKDKELYHTVVMKYMMPSKQVDTTKSETTETTKMDHTMHEMEGM